jgi:hypothetical protein
MIYSGLFQWSFGFFFWSCIEMNPNTSYYFLLKGEPVPHSFRQANKQITVSHEAFVPTTNIFLFGLLAIRIKYIL